VAQSVFAPSMVEPMIRGVDGATYQASSFGLGATTFGPGFRATQIVNGERWRQLLFRENFFTCKHHDSKLYDWNGCIRKVGGPNQPFIGGAMPTQYVSHELRRPSSPFRLPRLIVNSFTSLVFGHGQWPAVRVVGDPDTQDFVEALVKAQRLPAKMIQARNIGGSIGTVGLSWRFYGGVPRTKVHKGYRLHVHEWEDRDELIPSHVSEIYLVMKDEYDVKKKTFLRKPYWHREDWTEVADVRFVEVPASMNEEPEWVIDDQNTHVHDDGFAHFVWIQNLPSDDDGDGGIDGQPDYAELYENFSSIDMLNSVVVSGGVRNLDPTLVVKTDVSAQRMGGVIRKGSDNSITPGPLGDAKYLELSGTSITAGLELRGKERDQALEVAQCVSPSPDTIAAAGTSSLGIKMVFFPMLGKGDILRTQYGQGIERLLDQQVRSARKALSKSSDPVIETDEETGEEREVEYFVALPPRVIEEEVLDANGKPTGEVRTKITDRKPGDGGQVDLDWPEYFERTDDDRSKKATALATAVGGKPVMSQKSAVEKMAADYNLDPTEEWQRVAQAQREQQDAQSAMFPPMGGGVSQQDELPDGASPKGPGDEPEAPSVDALSDVMTVDEFRAMAKPPLPPWVNPDEGKMTVAEFVASRKSKGTEQGKVVGQAAGKAEVAPEPTSSPTTLPQEGPAAGPGGNPSLAVPVRPEPTEEPPG
jgi:hypothetical protein